MINLLQHAQDVMAGKTTIDNPRSPRWPAVRDAYLKEHPACAVSGRTDHLNVHHIKPFHLFPALELDPSNFITLYEGPGVNYHLLFGHLGDFHSYNSNVVSDSVEWKHKIGTFAGDAHGQYRHYPEGNCFQS